MAKQPKKNFSLTSSNPSPHFSPQICIFSFLCPFVRCIFVHGCAFVDYWECQAIRADGCSCRHQPTPGPDVPLNSTGREEHGDNLPLGAVCLATKKHRLAFNPAEPLTQHTGNDAIGQWSPFWESFSCFPG